MAVYTTLAFEEINTALQRFGIGELLHFEGISAGMENSNYFVTTASHHLAGENGEHQGEYVLTLFEELPESHLPFHIDLLQTLQRHGIAVAAPINDYDGRALQTIKGKPAVLCPRLSGDHPSEPNVQQCRVLGQTLAQIHMCLKGFKDAEQHPGIRDTAWLQSSVEQAADYLDKEENTLANAVLQQYLQMLKQQAFPQSLIHGDLFHDNSLFDGDTLSGIIDFFNAGFGHCIYDLAIVVNDWCLDAQGDINPEHYQQLLQAYASERPFTSAERQYWPLFLQVCALRFWISRLLSQKQQLNNRHELIVSKDPLEYKRILIKHLGRSSVELPG